MNWMLRKVSILVVLAAAAVPAFGSDPVGDAERRLAEAAGADVRPALRAVLVNMKELCKYPGPGPDFLAARGAQLLPTVLDLLLHDAEVSEQAERLLARLDGQRGEALAALRRAAVAGPPAVRLRAAGAAGRFGGGEGVLVPAVIAAARDPEARGLAVGTLLRASALPEGAEADALVAVLVGLLAEVPDSELWGVGEALRRQGGPAVGPLARLARGGEGAAPLRAVHVLHSMGHEAAAAVPDLIAVLGSADPLAAGAAARALRAVADGRGETVSALRRALHSTAPAVRLAAAEALLALAPADGPTLAGPVLEVLPDADDDLRLAIVDFLGELGADARAAVPALRRLLNRGSLRSQLTAARALTRIDPACDGESVPVLGRVCRCALLSRPREHGLAEECLKTLTGLQDRSRPVLPEVRWALSVVAADEERYWDVDVMLLVDAGLAAGGEQDVIAFLVRLLGSRNRAIRGEVADELAYVGAPAVAAVRAALAAGSIAESPEAVRLLQTPGADGE